MSEIELHYKAMKSSKLSKKIKNKFLPLTHQGRSYRGDKTKEKVKILKRKQGKGHN